MQQFNRRSILRAGTLLPLAGLGACSFHASPLTPYAPSMWRATAPNAAASYTLLGSVHQGYWRFYPLPAAVEQAFAQAEGLLVELESGRRFQELKDRFAPVVRQPPGRTLQDEIGSDNMQRLVRLMRADFAQIQQIQSLRPWAVSLQLQSPSDAQLETHSRQGLDSYFLEQAYRRRKTVLELETVDEQVHALSAGSSAEQIALLTAHLSALESWDSVLGDIIDAWRSGDDGRMASLRDKHFPQQGPARGYRERVLHVRDATMAQRLLNHSHQISTQTPRQFFVLVGAMHLVGPGNLLEHLIRIGFDLNRLPTAA